MRSRRLAALGALLLALTACGKPPVKARPAMWRVSDGDTTIWLLGSIHLLPANVRWRTPIIEQAIREADTLVLESSPDDHADFRALAQGTGLQPADQRVSPGKRPILDAMIVRSGIDRAMLDRYKDWALAATLAAGDATALGGETKYGVEAQLANAFDQAGKTRTAFYRIKDQLLFLDGLSPTLQREMLENTLAGKENYWETLKAWETGDIASLERGATCSPLDGKLVGQPNDYWSRWIAGRMAKPGNVLVAVGLGHMVGPYALPRLLAARGLKVERVQ
jgi:uncharacterized protein YbaP (TraB family)